MAVNKIILQGRLCAEPELRSTPGGTSVCSFRLAWSKKIKEREDQLFISCTAWGKLAEFVSQYFRKGQEVVAEGELQGRNWTDKDGGKHYEIELKADQVHFCGPKQESGGQSFTPAKKPVNVSAGGFAEMQDDGPLPF